MSYTRQMIAAHPKPIIRDRDPYINHTEKEAKPLSKNTQNEIIKSPKLNKIALPKRLSPAVGSTERWKNCLTMRRLYCFLFINDLLHFSCRLFINNKVHKKHLHKLLLGTLCLKIATHEKLYEKYFLFSWSVFHRTSHKVVKIHPTKALYSPLLGA